MNFMTVKEAAESLLGYYNQPGGKTPGGFATQLITAFEKADPSNRRRLLTGFPEFTVPLTVLQTSGAGQLSKLVLGGELDA